MEAPPTFQSRYRIGAVDVLLTSSIAWVIREHRRLYERHLVQGVAGRPFDPVHIHVTRSALRPFRRHRYIVQVAGSTQFEPAKRQELIPYIEWAMNWEVPKVLPQFLQFHASSLVIDGLGIMLPGESGSGKSTLTTGLLAGGARYLCDEFAMVHADTLQLHPYPRAICIKKPSFDAVESVGVSIRAHQYYVKGSKGHVAFIRPHEFGGGAIGSPCPVRFIVFPKYSPGAAPTLTPISRTEAAFALHHFCFNLLDARCVGLDVIAALVRGASCYRLTSGDLRETVDLLRNEVRSVRGRDARSA